MPRSHWSGCTVKGPKNPTLPQFVRKFDPISVAVQLGPERPPRVSPPACPHEVDVAEELLRFGRSKEGAERSSEDPVGPVEVTL